MAKLDRSARNVTLVGRGPVRGCEYGRGQLRRQRRSTTRRAGHRRTGTQGHRRTRLPAQQPRPRTDQRKNRDPRPDSPGHLEPLLRRVQRRPLRGRHPQRRRTAQCQLGRQCEHGTSAHREPGPPQCRRDPRGHQHVPVRYPRAARSGHTHAIRRLPIPDTGTPGDRTQQHRRGASGCRTPDRRARPSRHRLYRGRRPNPKSGNRAGETRSAPTVCRTGNWPAPTTVWTAATRQRKHW